MTVYIKPVKGYSTVYPSDAFNLFAPRDWKPGDGGHRIILFNHGRGASNQAGADTSGATPGYQIWALVNTGFVVLYQNNLGPSTWGGPEVMRALDDVYDWCVNTAVMPTAKIGILGWSMGGLCSMNWMMRNQSKVAAAFLFNPALDMRYFHDGPTYAPPYDLNYVGGTDPVPATTVYQSEIEANYSPSTTASAAVTMPASGSAGITLPIANGKGFGALPPNVTGALQATAPGGTFTYTSKDDTNLYGCVSTGASFAVASGAAISQTYAQTAALNAYNPFAMRAWVADPANWSVPLRIARAEDDALVPPHAADYFQSAVAANPNVLPTYPAAQGGHTGVFAYTPFDYVQRHYTDRGVW